MQTAKELDGNKFISTFIPELMRAMPTLEKDEVMPNHYKHPKHHQAANHLLLYAHTRLDEVKEKEKEEMSIINEIDKAKYIRWLVARFGGFDVTDPDFLIGKKNGNSKRKFLRFTDCRQAGMYLCDKHTEAERHEISNLFGRRDRTTVTHSIKKVKDMLKSQDDFFMAIVQYVEVQLEIKLLSTSGGAKRHANKFGS